MRRHVLNHLTERRRRIARGHSYNLPDGRSQAWRKRKNLPEEGQLYLQMCMSYALSSVQRYPEGFYVAWCFLLGEISVTVLNLNRYSAKENITTEGQTSDLQE